MTGESLTLLEVLERHAAEEPGRPIFSFGGEDYDYRSLWEGSGRFAALLQKRGLERGDRVVMALPNGPEFFSAFYGAQRAGGVAVPIFADSGPRRIRAMVELCGARALVLPGERAKQVPPEEAREQGVAVLAVDESEDLVSDAVLTRVEPDDVAYLQYTSGSTGDPKGVQVSHANLLANIHHLISGMEITPDEVMVSWLPAYHDMGLVLMTMVPFYLKARLVLLPTSLRNIHDWLEAIENEGGTFTAAPDFAYRLCLRYVSDPGTYDLSSLRVALNAAEPVRAGTVAQFEQHFGLERVMTAGYGLAEATVGVSMSPPGAGVRVDDHGVVSVGPSFPGVDVEILADEDGGRAPSRQEGEILVRSEATTRGYFRNPEATADLLLDDGFLRTGDLGYLDEDGNLFVAGRKKNIIIHGGRNLAPREIEELVDELASVRLSAAVGVDRGGTEGEQVYVFAEVRDDVVDGDAGGDRHDLVVQIVEAIHDELGFRPARAYLVRPRTIPMTANGKIRHLALKEGYVSGELKGAGAILFPDY